jgi:polyisoprenoid-binding protein YceI
VPADGQTITATAHGQLTLHGQTRDVDIPLSAKRSGFVVVVTGSLPIVLADYGIPKPNSFGVLSIADQGTMEFQIFFSKG